MNSKILQFIFLAFVLASCGSSKKFQANYAEDKPLFAAINELNKRPSNEKAQNDLRLLYEKSVERHEEAISVYRNGSDQNRLDKVLSELNALQNIYNSLQATPGSFGIVKPKNYLRDIEEAKQQAAEEYYARGQELIKQGSREAALEAWQSFKRANEYVNGYKDVINQIRDAYEKGIVYVVIGEVEEDNVFFPASGGWGFQTDIRYRPQDYQDQLIRELGGRTASYSPARFFSDRDVRRENISVDWEVLMRWRNINPVRQNPRQYTRNTEKKIENGKDTSGKPVYKTVYATLYITENSFLVQGEIEYRVNEVKSRNSIDNGNVRDQVSWVESSATYTGDSRALSQQDWNLVNNRSGFNQPSKGDVLNALMKKLYPDLKRRIQDVVN